MLTRAPGCRNVTEITPLTSPIWSFSGVTNLSFRCRINTARCCCARDFRRRVLPWRQLFPRRSERPHGVDVLARTIDLASRPEMIRGSRRYGGLQQGEGGKKRCAFAPQVIDHRFSIRGGKGRKAQAQRYGKRAHQTHRCLDTSYGKKTRNCFHYGGIRKVRQGLPPETWEKRGSPGNQDAFDPADISGDWLK